MRKSSILLMIALLTGPALFLSAESYDKAVVSESMRAHVARIGTIKGAIAAGDFYAAGKAFFEYGEEAAAMRKMDPPKGAKEEWDRIWTDFQDTAFKGVGACGERDGEKSMKILDDLVAFSKVGHPAFR